MLSDVLHYSADLCALTVLLARVWIRVECVTVYMLTRTSNTGHWPPMNQYHAQTLCRVCDKSRIFSFLILPRTSQIKSLWHLCGFAEGGCGQKTDNNWDYLMFLYESSAIATPNWDISHGSVWVWAQPMRGGITVSHFLSLAEPIPRMTPDLCCPKFSFHSWSHSV